MKRQAKRNTAANPKDEIQWGLDRAVAKGWRIIEPKPNELQLDLDGARALRAYGMQYSILRRQGLTRGWRERIIPSKKSGHVHVIITLPKESVPEVSLKTFQLIFKVCAQAVLSSDLRREAFNLCRVLNGNKYPIVLFEAKGSVNPSQRKHK